MRLIFSTLCLFSLAGVFGQAAIIQPNSISVYVNASSGQPVTVPGATPSSDLVYTPTQRINIVAAGNSLTSGYNSTQPSANANDHTGTDWPSVMYRMLNNSLYDVRNVSISGIKTVEMTQANMGFSWYDGNNYPAGEYLFAWEMTNDLAQEPSNNADSVYNHMRDYCLAARARGFKVIVSNMILRITLIAGRTVQQFETERQAANAKVAATWPQFADAFVDIASANLQQYPGWDGTHPSDSGYRVAAKLYIQGLYKLILQGSGFVGVPNNQSYTLTSSARISAGVYKVDSLVRTIESGTNKSAGTYSMQLAWDGKRDDLTTDAPAGNYTIKVQANNISTQWEGVIGNTSDSLTGPTVHRTFLPFCDMVINNNIAYVAADFAEREGSVYGIDLNSIQKKIDILPHNTSQQITERLCTDGVRLYMGGRNSQLDTMSYVAAAKFDSLGDYTKYLIFQNDYVQTFGAQYRAADKMNNAGRISGMAVQQSGKWLFVARMNNNSIHVCHKIYGNMVYNFSIAGPTLLAVDGSDNLWVAQANGSLRKYTVNATTGALTLTSQIIEGLYAVKSLNIRGDTITVTDAGAYHQVKGYSATSGALLWTLGRTESYSTNANIYNDKFYFEDQRSDPATGTFATYQADGSLWVGDKGNYRYLKFSPTRVYQTQIAFLPHCWSSYVDPNNISRVFADYLEYSVDYSKQILLKNTNNAWALVKNWGMNVPSEKDGDHDRLRFVTTLSNNRTFALAHNPPYNWEFVELVNNGALRFTGKTFSRYESYQLRPDGSITGFDYTGPGIVWNKRNLTGFDGSGNPLHGTAYNIASTPGNPASGGPTVRPAEITSTNVIVAFLGTLDAGYHLAGLPIGGTDYKWRTAKTINTTNYSAPYPLTGDYEVGKGSQFAGSTALAMDSIIIWGNRGEFYNGGQTNIWNIVSDKGLFLKQFGTISAPFPGTQAQPEMAGNAFSPSLVKYGGSYYLWHNDESYHGGLHRWKISGLNTGQQFNIPVTKN